MRARRRVALFCPLRACGIVTFACCVLWSPRGWLANATPRPGGSMKMKRRTLPPTSRIFVGRRPHWPRLVSAVVLTFALGITGFGIATAVYLDRPRAPADQTAAQRPSPSSLSVARAAEPAPAIAGSSLPKPPPSAAELAALSPEAGKPATTPAPPPAAPAPSAAAIPSAPARPAASVAALELAAPPPSATPTAPAPSAGPSPVSSATPYWVEYGVYAVARYAARLHQVLDRSGLESVVVRTHDPRGRPLLRVRSAPLGGLVAAQQAARQAETALGLAPLVHRGEPEMLAATDRYWVQFGAFRDARLAARLRHRLAEAGIAATVSSAQGTSGKSLYLVRSEHVSSRASAVALAQRGQPVTEAAALIGERPERAIGHHPPRAPPRGVVSAG